MIQNETEPFMVFFKKNFNFEHWMNQMSAALVGDLLIMVLIGRDRVMSGNQKKRKKENKESITTPRSSKKISKVFKDFFFIFFFIIIYLFLNKRLSKKFQIVTNKHNKKRVNS